MADGSCLRPRRASAPQLGQVFVPVRQRAYALLGCSTLNRTHMAISTARFCHHLAPADVGPQLRRVVCPANAATRHRQNTPVAPAAEPGASWWTTTAVRSLRIGCGSHHPGQNARLCVAASPPNENQGFRRVSARIIGLPMSHGRLRLVSLGSSSAVNNTPSPGGLSGRTGAPAIDGSSSIRAGRGSYSCFDRSNE